MSWYQLIDIYRDAEQLARTDIRERYVCPYDGQPLTAGPRNTWNCPWGDYEYPRDRVGSLTL